MAVLCIVFLICAFRVNICFVIIFFTLTLALIFLTVTYWLLAADYEGNAGMAKKMLTVSKTSAHAVLYNLSRRDGHFTD